ncbi:MAG TPA: hypothetical protein VGD49_01175 [Longimicrobiales bacterium]
METRLRSVFREGLVSGLIGYAVVILVVAAADLFASHPLFFTPALLGSYLFFDVRDPANVVIWAGPVIAYNGLHLVIFLLFGLFMAALAALADHGQQMWYIAANIFLIVVMHVVGIPILFDPVVSNALSLVTVITATTMAAVGMAVYLWRAHAPAHSRYDIVTEQA